VFEETEKEKATSVPDRTLDLTQAPRLVIARKEEDWQPCDRTLERAA
jgi:hypothetical protein